MSEEILEEKNRATEIKSAFNKALKLAKYYRRMQIFLIASCALIIFVLIIFTANLFGGFGIPGVDMLGLAMGFTESSFGSNQPVASTGSSIGGRDKIVESIQKAKPNPTELDKAANNYFVHSMCSRLPKDKRPSEC